jgi:hypothetical protein
MAQRLEASRKGAKAKGRRQRKNDEREEGKGRKDARKRHKGSTCRKERKKL